MLAGQGQAVISEVNNYLRANMRPPPFRQAPARVKLGSCWRWVRRCATRIRHPTERRATRPSGSHCSAFRKPSEPGQWPISRRGRCRVTLFRKAGGRHTPLSNSPPTTHLRRCAFCAFSSLDPFPRPEICGNLACKAGPEVFPLRLALPCSFAHANSCCAR